MVFITILAEVTRSVLYNI